MSVYPLKVALEAESAWFNELVRLHGRNACDVRYTEEAKGEKGTALRQLYLDYRNATEYWRESIKKD